MAVCSLITEICKAPTLRLKALNKHTHIMYIEMENAIQIFIFIYEQMFKRYYAKDAGMSLAFLVLVVHFLCGKFASIHPGSSSKSDATHSCQCVQCFRVWLPVFGFVNVRLNVDTCVCIQRLCGQHNRVCTGR